MEKALEKMIDILRADLELKEICDFEENCSAIDKLTQLIIILVQKQS